MSFTVCDDRDGMNKDADRFGRPDWDSYFMGIAFVAAMRSLDPATKHGCIITKNRKIIGTGYNGPPRNVDDRMIPLTRPEKYPFMAHAEENAILNSDDTDLRGARVYVTGHPCHRCFRMLLQKDVATILYGCVGSNMVDKEESAATYLMLSAHRSHANINGTKALELIPYQGTSCVEVLNSAVEYYQEKCGQRNS